MQPTPFPSSAFPTQAVPVASRCLPLLPCGLGTPFQESLPSYINRLARAHALAVSTFLSRELVPLISSATEYSPVSNYLGRGSRYLLLGNGLASEIAAQLARLTLVPQVTALVHPYLAGSLGWTRDLREHVAWCPQCFVEWNQAGKPLYFPLLWAFRATRCCLHHNVLLRDDCPYCWHHSSYLLGRIWEGQCFECGRAFGDSCPVSAPSHIDTESTRLVQGLVAWAAGLTAPADLLSVLLTNLAVAATVVGGAKPLSNAIGRSPSVVGFWLRRRQSPTLTSLLRLGLVFGVPLEDWLSGALGPERFENIGPVPDDVPWLSDRATPVPVAHVDEVLRLSLDNPADPPPSLFALACSIPVSPSHLYHNFPELASRIVKRHRAYCAQRKARYAIELAALVRAAIAERRARGLVTTPYAVLAHLGSRWPLSRRRLRAVFQEVSST
jgi:hypothetical protein